MMGMQVGFRRVVLLAVATIFLGGGCAEGADERPPASTLGSFGALGTAGEIARSSEQIDIGGRSLHLMCWGKPVPGEPTVLLISGLGPDTYSWALMAREFAAEDHQLCAYDRAGIGGSESPPKPRVTMEDQVADLLGLLDAADLQEPVVVVAHSLGSLPAVGLVDRAPERVAGVVLLDPWGPRVSAAQRAALPPKKADEPPAVADERRFVTDYVFDPTQNPEHLLIAASDKEVVRLLDEPGRIFGGLPVVVLRAPPLTRPPGMPRSYHLVTLAAISDGHKEFVAESTRGTLIQVEDTGHNIHDDKPEVVMDAISDVMAG